MSLSPFEPYLDVQEQYLQLLSQEERADWREEARQHLQDIARAEEELGFTHDEATVRAMRKFGDAAQIGRQMARSTQSDPLRGRKAAALFSGPLVIAMLLLIGVANAYVLTDSPRLFLCLQVASVLSFVSVPILGGLRVGRSLRPGQSYLPVAVGLILTGLFFLPIAGVLLEPILYKRVGGEALDFRWALLWLPLTLFSLMLSRRRDVRRAETVVTRAG